MRLRSLAAATALAVAATPLLTGSATAADATIGGTLSAAYVPCNGDTFFQTTSPSSPSYAVPADGVITSYRFQITGQAPTSVSFKTARATGSGAFTVVGSSAASAPTAGESLMQRTVRIPAKAGDVIGLYAPGANNCFQYDIGNASALTRVAGDAAVGTTTTSPPEFGAVLNIAATVEPDADNDGFGDTTQDQCTTNAAAQGPCPVVVPKDTAAPDTTITSAKAAKVKASKPGKKKKAKTATVTVAFTATETSTFTCSIDRAAFTACASPLVTKLKKGTHTIAVRATDAAGNVDPTPATTTVKVKKAKAKKK